MDSVIAEGGADVDLVGLRRDFFVGWGLSDTGIDCSSGAGAGRLSCGARVGVPACGKVETESESGVGK